MGLLTVYLDKVTNLKDADGMGQSDPYVKLELEKDNWAFDRTLGNYQSKKKQNDINPEYGETFLFSNIDSIKDMVLHVKVMDDDVGRDDCIGKCTVKLDELDLAEEPTEHIQIIDNKGLDFLSARARVHLKISYKD